MNIDKSTLKVCFVDNIGGCYLPAALIFSKHFAHTYYHIPVNSPFPRISSKAPGIGYEEIEVLDSIWPVLDSIDLFIFGDIYQADLATQLRKMGKLVFGGGGDLIETNRKLFSEILERLNMPVIPSVFLMGTTALRKYLTRKKSKFVKISYWRGEAETFEFININYNKVQLDEIEFNLGPLNELVEFQVQDSMDCVAEVGYDGWSVNGVFPQNGVTGLEVKNCGYVGVVKPITSMPKPVQEVNLNFAPALKSYRHNGFFSSEIRYTKDGISYFTDPCMRLGSPPSISYLSNCSNLGKCIEAAAKGEILEPTYFKKYMCEIILKSSYCINNYMPVLFPEQYKSNVFIKGSFIIDGKYYTIPFLKAAGYTLEEFGSVCVFDNTIESAMEQALEIANSIEAYEIHFDKKVLETATNAINKVETALNWKF
jgi:hypothetical protein